MKIEDIKGSYDYIASIGDNCQPAHQLDRLQLRKSSGPFDWIATRSLDVISLLISNRFANFMDNNYLVIDGQDPGSHYYNVRETLYNLYSMHDFPITNDWIASYTEAKAKFDRRAQRFLHQIENCQSILLVRLMGTSEEAVRLKSVLSGIVKGNFSILLINYHDNNEVLDLNLIDENICSVLIPNDPNRWEGNDGAWSALFNGITLTGN